MESVNSWKPDKGSPSKIESKVVVANIDGSKVPVFVDEEIDHVYCVKQCSDEDGFGDIAMKLILIGNERKVA